MKSDLQYVLVQIHLEREGISTRGPHQQSLPPLRPIKPMRFGFKVVAF